MDNLVFCPCGHALDIHTDRGCAGNRAIARTCPHTSYEALEAAVTAARTAGAEAALRGDP